MKITRRTLLFFMLALSLMAVSCQPRPIATAPVQGGPAGATQVSPAQQPDATKISGGEAGSTEGAQGQFMLDMPDQGLSALKSYRQRLTSTIEGTLQGQPFAYSETVERTVSAADETERVEATTNGEALYRYGARLGETFYSQTNADTPCRAAPAAEHPMNENPARKLPPVYGAAAGTAGVYTFDARAVPNVAGKNDQGSGEISLAGQGGMVTRYDLAVEVKEGEFIGMRTWHYTLEVGDFTLALPPNCMPLLDLPLPPGAADVVNQPGIMLYTIQTSQEEVRQFYLSALAEAGWKPLPSTSVAPDPNAPKDVVVLTFTKANPNGSGRVAVIQLIESEGALKAAIQEIRAKKAVESYDPEEVSAAPEDDKEQHAEDQPPADQPKLPEGLPEYPDGKIMAENESMVMFTTPDSPEAVIEFYTDTLEQAGWEQIQEMNAQGTMMRTWQKGDERVRIAVSEQGGETTVMLMPG